MLIDDFQVLLIFFISGIVIAFGITAFAIYKDEQKHKFRTQHSDFYEEY